jgi:Rrf2 family iron-sulfur cluster assembly transcriptional regulator
MVKHMMCLTQTTGYAIRALGCLGLEGCRPHLIRDVATCSGVNKPYLAKIFNKLSTSGLITSKRGYRGGITLTRPASEISLLEIVKAVEGEQWIGPCLLGMSECASGVKCPTSAQWKQISRQIETVLETTTLADVVSAMKREHRSAATPSVAVGRVPSKPITACDSYAQAQ